MLVEVGAAGVGRSRSSRWASAASCGVTHWRACYPRPVMTFAEFVEEYQTLVAGLAGFTGVIITLLVNASLARKQDTTQARLAREQRDHERELAERHREEELEREQVLLRRVLLCELFHNSRMCQKAINVHDTDKNGDLWLESIGAREAFDRLMPRLGALSPDEVGKVMHAYYAIEWADALKSISAIDQQQGIVKVKQNHADQVARAHRTAHEKANEAIHALEAASDLKVKSDRESTDEK